MAARSSAQIGSLYATIDADMRGLERGITSARAKLSEFGKNLDGIKGGAAAAGRGLDDLGQNMEQVGKKTSHAHGASKGFFGEFKMGLATIAGGFAAAQIGISAVQKGLSAIAGAAVGLNARLEQAKVGFTTMLGSATAASSFVQKLYKFAAETPFEFEGLLQNTQLLKAMGFEADQLIPVLTDVGDAMAAMGRGGQYIDRVVLALGQMQQKGRLMGQEALQLAEAGINIYGILADQMGKTAVEVRELGEAGEISAEMAIGAFRKFVQANYGGAMAAQAKTAAGAWTTLTDSIKMFVATAAEPGFKALRDLTVGSAELGQSKGAESFAKSLNVYVQDLLDGLRGVTEYIKNIKQFIEETNVDTSPRVKAPEGSASKALEKINSTIVELSKMALLGIAYPLIGWGAAARKDAEALQQMTERGKELHSTATLLASATQGTTAAFRDQADAIQANIRAASGFRSELMRVYDDLYTNQALFERLPWAQGPGLADMASKGAAGFGNVLAGYDASARRVSQAQEVIKSQLDAIGDRISAVGRHAQDVAAAYDAQTQALQDQIDLVTKADPVKTEKDLQYQLKRNAIERKLLSAREGSYRETRLKEQLESLDKEARQNRLLMEQEAIQGRIAAIPLEEKLKGIITQRDAELKAIQDSATAMGRQRDVLQEQLDKVGSVKTALVETNPILDENIKRAAAWREESDKLLANYQAIKETAASIPVATPDPGDPFSKGNAAAAGQGGLRNPFDWMKEIYQSTRQGVGYQTAKGWQPHDWGVDWAMPFGTKLKAIGQGVVSQIIEGYNSGFGNTMVVTLANGMKAFYSHLSGFAKKVGDKFNLGDIIASSGGVKSIQGAGAGESTGAHLDFRLMQDNKYLNVIKTLAQGIPIPFVRGQGGGVGGDAGALDAAANAAAGLADIAKLFKEIGKFGDVPTAAIDKLLSGVQMFMERMNDLRGKWEPQTVEDLGNFSDGVAYVFAPLKEALDVLDRLANLSAIKKGAIPKFFDKLAVIISEMNALKVGAADIKLGALGAWAERLAPVLEPLKAGIDVLAGLADMPAFKKNAIPKFFIRLSAIFKEISALKLGTAMLGIKLGPLGEWAQRLGPALEPLKAGMDVLAGLAELPAFKKNAIPKFFIRLAAIIREVQALQTSTQMLTIKVGPLGEWAQRLAPALEPLKAGIDVLAGLADMPAFKKNTIPKFFIKLAAILKEISALKLGTAMLGINLGSLGKWAKPLADIFAPIANAVQGLASLVDFKRPGEKVLMAFKNSLKRFLVLMKQLSKDPLLKKHAMKVAAEIAKNWGDILSVLGSAGGLKDLGEFKAPGEGQLQAFKASLKRFLVLMKQLARDPAFEGEHQLDKAVSFANKANTIVTLLNSSMDGFAALKEKGAAPAEALAAMVAGLAAALNRMDELVEWSKLLLDGATQFRDNLLEVVKRLNEGLDAIGNLPIMNIHLPRTGDGDWTRSSALAAAPLARELAFAGAPAGGGGSNGPNLNVQRITINTAATDAEGIAEALMYELENVNYRMGRKASRRMRTMVR